MKARIIETLHTPTGKVVYEVIKMDNCKFPHLKWFDSEKEAQDYCNNNATE